jgi:hypothetical protein
MTNLAPVSRALARVGEAVAAAAVPGKLPSRE